MSTTERPILFSGPMVTAILAGRKSVTRRVVNPQPASTDFVVGRYSPTKINSRGEEYPGREAFGVFSRDGDYGIRCPYGSVGSRLYVREKFAYVDPCAGVLCNPYVSRRVGVMHGSDVAVVYATEYEMLGFDGPWKPSIYMPRWASRIMLKITYVRVERLNDISEADAIAEGSSCIEMFAGRWESINGIGAWDLHPWVWVVCFSVE